MLSILPAKVLRIFEFIGFSGIVSLNAGNREFGMKCLALGADWPFEELQSPLKVALPKSAKNIAINFFSDEIPKETGIGTRKFMCDIMLHMYHVLFSSMIQLPGCNIPLATKMIDAAIVEHPNSFLYLLIRAKISQSERSLERGIAELDKVISVQKDWRQLAHLCFWDLGISNAALGNYETAADYFDILYKENEWSKSIYLYFRAVLLYAADSIKYKDIISDLMKKIPDHLKKVAGKSVPLEVSGI
jgi:tetratricopeptide (TPR) repeat protein